MLKNDPVTGDENIIQLTKVRRSAPSIARPTPSPTVPFESWVDLRDRAAAALLGGGRRLVLTGPAGTGKTVLIDHVAKVLRAAGRTVVVQLADADPAPPGAGTTLFVDEADRLSAVKLRALEASEGALVLVGLGTPGLRRLKPVLQLTLEPLGQEAARSYIAQWLASSGRVPAELDSKAVRSLVELSGGTPRLLSTLLAASIWLKETGGAATVGAEHVEEAAALRSVLLPSAMSGEARGARRARHQRALWSTLLAAGVIGGTALAVAPRLFPHAAGLAADRSAVLLAQAEAWVRHELGQNAPPPVPAVATPVAPPKQLVAEPVPAVATVPEPVVPAPEPASPPEPAEIVAPAPVATPAAPVAVSKLSSEIVASLMRRGREMLKLDDLSAARLLFRRAADDGNADAMFALGQTYDPAVLAGMGAASQADPAEAATWYGRATAAGRP